MKKNLFYLVAPALLASLLVGCSDEKEKEASISESNTTENQDLQSKKDVTVDNSSSSNGVLYSYNAEKFTKEDVLKNLLERNPYFFEDFLNYALVENKAISLGVSDEAVAEELNKIDLESVSKESKLQFENKMLIENYAKERIIASEEGFGFTSALREEIDFAAEDLKIIYEHSSSDTDEILVHLENVDYTIQDFIDFVFSNGDEHIVKEEIIWHVILDNYANKDIPFEQDQFFVNNGLNYNSGMFDVSDDLITHYKNYVTFNRYGYLLTYDIIKELNDEVVISLLENETISISEEEITDEHRFSFFKNNKSYLFDLWLEKNKDGFNFSY